MAAPSAPSAAMTLANSALRAAIKPSRGLGGGVLPSGMRPGLAQLRRGGYAACRTGAGRGCWPRKESAMGRAWAVVAMVLALAAGPASAQQQPQRDPFNGQFGVMELAQPPAEAARQAQLLADALRNLQPQRPGQQDVYLITAALWGDPVFAREATQAEAILRPHFGAEGRSIVLAAGGPGPRT